MLRVWSYGRKSMHNVESMVSIDPDELFGLTFLKGRNFIVSVHFLRTVRRDSKSLS